MATSKGGGSVKNGRDSNGQRLGVKRYGGEHVIPGNIIVRQHGTKIKPGIGVGMGKDYTIFAVCEGFVRFTGADRKKAHVLPTATPAGKPS